MPQKFCIVIFGMADGQIRQKFRPIPQLARPQDRHRNRPVHVRFAGNGDPQIRQFPDDSACRKPHEGHGWPALHGGRAAVVFLQLIQKGHL